MKHIPRKKPLATIVVTPLVDVVLVLLVLFLVLTPLVSRSIDVREPHKTQTLAPGETVPVDQLVVQARPDGVFLNGEALDPGDLGATLEGRMASNGARVVFFQGDPELPYRDVVRYLDIMRASGAEILGIAPVLTVDPPSPGVPGAEEEP